MQNVELQSERKRGPLCRLITPYKKSGCPPFWYFITFASEVCHRAKKRGLLCGRRGLCSAYRISFFSKQMNYTFLKNIDSLC